MSRSLVKGPFLTKQFVELLATNSPLQGRIKLYSRACVVPNKLIGLKVNIHTGKTFKLLELSNLTLNHKLGEFALTRVFHTHKKNKKKKQKRGKTKK